MKATYEWLVWAWSWLASRFRQTYKGRVVEGVYPAHLVPRTVYILTEDGEPWEGKFICPCGCRAVLDLNFIEDEPPIWRYSIDGRGFISLHPSVWRQVGCRSHFFIRNGAVIWARPD